MDICATFMVDGEEAELGESSQGSFDNPAMPPEAVAALDGALGDARLDAAFHQSLAAAGGNRSLCRHAALRAVFEAVPRIAELEQISISLAHSCTI